MAASKSISSGGNAMSDAVTPDAGNYISAVQPKADNDGSPASGDTATFLLLASLGDPDADPDVADEYTTAAQGLPLAVLNTHSGTGGSDPAIGYPAPIDNYVKGLKLYAVNNSGGRAITVSAQVAQTNLTTGATTYKQVTWS